MYEFEARSGYAVPVALVERLRETVPNLRGLKVSDRPWERVEPYLLDGLDVFVGVEALVVQGLERGAAGAVSGLAAVFPEVVAALVARADGRAGRRGRAAALGARPASRSTRPRRPCSGGAASRCAPTSELRSAVLTDAELAELELP